MSSGGFSESGTGQYASSPQPVNKSRTKVVYYPLHNVLNEKLANFLQNDALSVSSGVGVEPSRSCSAPPAERLFPANVRSIRGPLLII
jgi:hypothetical protein